MNDLTLDRIVAYLATGFTIRFDDHGDALLMKSIGQVRPDLLRQLNAEGWLTGFANGSGARLSDAGRTSFMQSMDEMGNGVLRAPHRETGEAGSADAARK